MNNTRPRYVFFFQVWEYKDKVFEQSMTDTHIPIPEIGEHLLLTDRSSSIRKTRHYVVTEKVYSIIGPNIDGICEYVYKIGVRKVDKDTIL